MGIVMAVFMLLGLLLVSPWKALSLQGLGAGRATVGATAIGVLVAGMWNALWHGLRYLDTFWGLAALVSGTLMIAVAVITLARHGAPAYAGNTLVKAANRVVKPFELPIVLGLLACFLLYAVTLVQLNLGYAIIGN